MTRVYDKKSITEQIQRYLSYIDTGIAPPAPTGVYDEKTKNAVMNFQRKNNIEATGSVDELTMLLLYNRYLEEKINEKARKSAFPFINFPITAGARSDGLIQIHRMIAFLLDYYGHTHRIRESNFYNEETEKAVDILRKIYFLDEINIIDEKLYFRILNDYSSINKLKVIN